MAIVDDVKEVYAKMLVDSMPRIEQALMESNESQASFTVTAQFAVNKQGEVVLSLKPRERVPMPTVEMKLRWHDKQLRLL
jgi:hypothetical protein